MVSKEQRKRGKFIDKNRQGAGCQCNDSLLPVMEPCPDSFVYKAFMWFTSFL
ncbi:hypothetical protein CBFG_05057 [Clostridiales bacterium 1_7_47FAA]|nr:hypothetical protein CBFG_05057 [Clostridiales bacterium 1_7_47FAA]